MEWTIHGVAKLLSHDGAVLKSAPFQLDNKRWQLSLHVRDEECVGCDARIELQTVDDEAGSCCSIVQWAFTVGAHSWWPETSCSDHRCWIGLTHNEVSAACANGALTVIAEIAIPTAASGKLLADSLLALLDSGRESDVSFVVDYVKIPAHKAILAQHSKELKVLMDQCKDGVIKLENSSEEAVRKLLRLPPAVCHA